MIYRVSASWARGEFQRHRYKYELWSHVHRQHVVHVLDPIDLRRHATYTLDDFTVGALTNQQPLGLLC